MHSFLSSLDLTGTGSCGSFNFRRTTRAVTRFYDQALQESGIRSTQFAILVGIAKSQPVSIGAIADLLAIDNTTLTRSLRLLKKERLISISARSVMRQRFVSLTPSGGRVLARSLPIWRKAHEQFVAGVGSDYWVKLQSELEQLTQTAIGLDPQAGGLRQPASAAH